MNDKQWSSSTLFVESEGKWIPIEEIECMDVSIEANSITTDQDVDATPNEELRELVDKWRMHAEVGNTEYAKGVQDCFRECADELEELIND